MSITRDELHLSGDFIKSLHEEPLVCRLLRVRFLDRASIFKPKGNDIHG